MCQCQKRTLFFQTLDWTKPLPPIQFSLFISDSTSRTSHTKGGGMVGKQQQTNTSYLLIDLACS